MSIAFDVPLNSLSFGNVSIALLYQAYKKGLQPAIFPVGGQADLSAQTPTGDDFQTWLVNNINKTLSTHSRSTPVIRLWHINDALRSISDQQYLLTFNECDTITSIEINILKNQSKVIVTSKFTKQVFEDYGLTNVYYLNLGFDNINFFKKDKKYFSDDRIVFGLFGKLEGIRKNHEPSLKAWAKRFGNDKRYFLNCLTFNPFLKPEDQLGMISHWLEGKKYFNIQFLSYLKTNTEVNDYYNSLDIAIGMHGAEGFNLPLYNCMALGKHAVVLNAHCHKDYCNNDNAVLVNPNGKRPIYDGIFFHQGAPFSQGNSYTFSDLDYISGCEEAIKRRQSRPVNTAGLELQKRTYKEVFEDLLKIIES